MTHLRLLSWATITLSVLMYFPPFAGAQNNSCPTDWRRAWAWFPNGSITPPATPPPHKVGDPITLTATSLWLPGAQCLHDFNGCILTNREYTSVSASPVEWWTTRYGTEPVTSHSGSGLTASFTGLHGCTVQVNFYTSNYDNSLPPPAVSDYATSASVTIYELVHECVADCPGDPLTRTTLGVGEHVSLRIVPGPPAVTWNLDGVGSLSNPTANPTDYFAGPSSGSATIKATTSDGIQVSIGFSVASPSSLVFQNKLDSLSGDCTDGWNRLSFWLHYWAYVYTLPDNVNFNNIELWEGDASPWWSGWSNPTAWLNHPANGPKSMLSCPEGSGLGNRMEPPDEISIPCGTAPQPSNQYTPDWGTVKWLIPWFYTTEGSSDQFIAYITQEGDLSGGDLWSVTKAQSGAYIYTPDCVPHWQ